MDRILIIRRLGKNYNNNGKVHDVMVMMMMTMMMTMMMMKFMVEGCAGND